jgi:hypothetical protein
MRRGGGGRLMIWQWTRRKRDAMLRDLLSRNSSKGTRRKKKPKER